MKIINILQNITGIIIITTLLYYLTILSNNLFYLFFINNNFYSCGIKCTENGSPISIKKSTNNNYEDTYLFEKYSDNEIIQSDNENDSIKEINMKLKMLGICEIPSSYNSTHLKFSKKN